jgi:nucleoside-diphosphate-sugar epimerase
MKAASTNRVLVTGASGFVGLALIGRLIDGCFESKAISRKPLQLADSKLQNIIIPDLNSTVDLSSYLDGIGVVVHLAGRVHMMNDAGDDNLTKYRSANVDSTINLARQAAALGVRRFIYISSIKVNGEFTFGEDKFFADDHPNPEDPYGISKLEAEVALKKLAKETGLEVVIIRPPLVYGPKVRANFASMMNWLYKGIPLPFGMVKNRRSLVSLDNLVDLIITCIDHRNAANQTFLVSDDHDVSTTTLLKSMSTALGKKSILAPIPAFILRAFFFSFGRKKLSQRLLSSLQVDITKTKELLNWKPPLSFEESIRLTALDFLNNRHANNKYFQYKD